MPTLQQTRGKIRIEGTMIGFDPENGSYREGETKLDQRPYRSIQFGIKTSPKNSIFNVELFGILPDKPVKAVKFTGNKNREYFEAVYSNRDCIPEGHAVFGYGLVGVGAEFIGNRQMVKNLFNYDAVKEIAGRFRNQDSIWLDAEFHINTYSINGESRNNIKYTIKKMGYTREIVDFEQEDFKEVASFEQTIVVTGHEQLLKEDKLKVYGRLINFNQSWNDIALVVDMKQYEKLANNILNKFHFGDVATVQGRIVNSYVYNEEIQETGNDWGGEVPEGQIRVVKEYVSELQITNVTEHLPYVYKESEFNRLSGYVGRDPFSEPSF